jgi:hypothetical protein
MRQGFKAHNYKDSAGNPTGGSALGKGLAILWQSGPLGRDGDRKEPNGAFVEDVIAVALQRLQFYNEAGFGCRQNAIAITKLEEALFWLRDRTEEREKRGVEGTHQR